MQTLKISNGEVINAYNFSELAKEFQGYLLAKYNYLLKSEVNLERGYTDLSELLESVYWFSKSGDILPIDEFWLGNSHCTTYDHDNEVVFCPVTIEQEMYIKSKIAYQLGENKGEFNYDYIVKIYTELSELNDILQLLEDDMLDEAISAIL